MRRTFNILEDFLFLAIVIAVGALVTVAVYTGNDSYPLVSAANVVTSAEDRGAVGPALELAPAPQPEAIAAISDPTPVMSAAPMISTGDASAN